MESKEITSVAFIGLGALGINFACYIAEHAKGIDLRIIADDKRIQRYRKEGIYYNGALCNFTYYSDQEECERADLVLFCTKFHGLEDAMKSMRHQIGNDTIIMSAINGISSEEVLAQTYKKQNILYTVAQGMDATKQGNRVCCENMGELCFGDVMLGEQAAQIKKVQAFFDSIAFPYEIKKDILHHQWGKFMLNVGLNQVVAKYHGTYQTVQKQGLERDEMIAAMKEVQELSNHNGICLTKEELQSWITMIDTLSPSGKPSMAQDVEAKRKTEVELFSGTMLTLAKQYHLDVPVNEMLYACLTDMEHEYL